MGEVSTSWPWRPGQAAPRQESQGFTFHDVSEVAGRSVSVFRLLELNNKPITPLTDPARFSPKARYGLLPVGTTPETALALVWDTGAEGGPVLWLDADGDGQLAAEERHAFSGKELSVAFRLMVRKGEGEETARRTVLLRRSSLGPGLSYAVRGCLRGELRFGTTAVAAVLVDASGDGCFHGAGVDRVWLDLNRDGSFDPLAEQFTLGRPIIVEGTAYIVAAEPLGQAVRARQRGTETGRLRLELPAAVRGRVARFHADLLNDLGEMVSLTGEGQSLDVPSGRYRLSALSFTVIPDANHRWHYTFRGYGETTHEVTPGGERRLAVLHDLKLEVYHDGKAAGSKPGTVLTARPFLHDASGLYAINCYQEEGTLQRPGIALVHLRTAQGKVLETFTSGFN